LTAIRCGYITNRNDWLLQCRLRPTQQYLLVRWTSRTKHSLVYVQLFT